jgi:outer membrane lipoprotein-sorting protein
MHDRYAGTWYRSLTFTQESVTHKADGSRSSETWHEALSLPGRLRIDFGDPKAGNGALFVSDHQYVYKSMKLVNDKPRIHPLLVMGFDVYAQPVDKTIQQLKDLHIDLTALHEERWQGRPTIVIGAKAGDLRSPQFWIDKERLYFVRLLQPDERNASSTQDIRFDHYRRVEGGGWLAQHVAVYTDDKLVFEEKYSEVRINPPLPDQLFDPKNFSGATN